MGWLVLLAILGVAGWVTSFPVVMLLTLRMDGKDPGPDNWPTRYQGVVAIVLAAIYFILLGNAISWQFEPNG